MKYLLIVLAWLPFFVLAQKESEISFQKNLSWWQVKQKAKEEGKYIFLDLYTTWCGPCKLMDRDVYSNDTVEKAINNKFIAVKIQMDSTSYDNDYVKSWYVDARELGIKYAVEGYPSFLFFTPDAQLTLKELGYKGVSDFLNMVNLAIDPNRAKFYLKLEDYKGGTKDYTIMGALAVFAKNVVKDNQMGATIAKDYKINYLDKLSESELFKKENLDFIGEFNNLININDNSFNVCYNQAEKVDKIQGHEGWARYQVEQIIRNQELENKLVYMGKPLFKEPAWGAILKNLKKKYAIINVESLLINYEVVYYRFIVKNWRKWSKALDEKLKLFPPKQNGIPDVFFSLNLPAWDAFMNCMDKSVLLKALKWSELSIKLEEPNPDIQCLDTRANLMYKLGRIKEAIAQEEKTIKISNDIAKKEGSSKGPFIDEFETTISRMRKNEPTWNRD